MSNNLLGSLSARDLMRAASIRQKIEALEAELGRLLGSPSAPAAPRVSAPGGGGAKTGKSKRRLTAAGRAKLAASARARWVKARAAGKSHL